MADATRAGDAKKSKSEPSSPPTPTVCPAAHSLVSIRTGRPPPPLRSRISGSLPETRGTIKASEKLSE